MGIETRESGNPIEELRNAAKLMRERAQAVITEAWGDLPWQVEACVPEEAITEVMAGPGFVVNHIADYEEPGCPCIVYQGKYKADPLEAQVPPIQFVADGETSEHAAHIAGWGPRTALAVAKLLEDRADEYDEIVSGPYGPGGVEFVAGDLGGDIDPALLIARAYLGRESQQRPL